jgi:hypothetical protein
MSEEQKNEKLMYIFIVAMIVGIGAIMAIVKIVGG